MSYKYQRSFTSGGKKTSTANQVITFTEIDKIDGDVLKFSVAYLSFETFSTACRIRLNNEDTIHWIDANETAIITDFEIKQVTILDAGVEYYYTGFVPL